DSGALAHIDIRGRLKVGRYGVNLEEFEQKVVPILDAGREDVDLFVVDEIGKMECFSTRFVEAVKRVFRSKKKVLATVALKGGGFIGDVKKMESVRLLELKRELFENTVTEIVRILSASVIE
ncbi:MAG: nucleoside-triphosphatase, partial [Planctomycetota bacterium]